MNAHLLIPLFLCSLLTGCATSDKTAPAWPAPDTHCASDTVLLDAHFETGNLGLCTVQEDGSFSLELLPEDRPPINSSAWFAFRASGEPDSEVRIQLEFDHGYARYWPKTSADGTHWSLIPEDQVTGGGEAAKRMTFSFRMDGGVTWVAAQEILDSTYYHAWLRELDAVPGTSTRLLGSSVQGRPVYLVETGDRPELVLFIGRQHPPEVTGALGMRAFMDTVYSDTELAAAFRQRFMLATVPLMNPDGVAAGHWRHNVGDTDLNRDWGPFRQPETRAVIDWVKRQEAAGRELVSMLDFHSTWEDLFYTQPVVEDPPDFASRWLNTARERLPDFSFRHVPSSDLEQANSKNYFYNSRGIPAITYEVGDDTDRVQIRTAARVFAEEFMRLMLEM